MIKVKHHPDPDGMGAQFGDVVSFSRPDHVFSEKELKYFIPIPVDINVPCGDNYMKVVDGGYPDWNCSTCPDNDPDVCDVQKFVRGEWSEGDVENPPMLLKKRRYRIPIDVVLNSTMLALATKDDKNIADRTVIVNFIGTTNLPKTVVVDKVT